MVKIMFEKVGKSFMLEILKFGKLFKLNYLWGFYFFFECYNYYKGFDYNGSCYDIEKIRNDGFDWLWNESIVFYLFVYLNSKLKFFLLVVFFVRNRVQEVIRVFKFFSVESLFFIFIYIRLVFFDKFLEYFFQVSELRYKVYERVFINDVQGNLILCLKGMKFSFQYFLGICIQVVLYYYMNVK